MAGSYRHLIEGFSLIENMGDAQECIEELFWLVERHIGQEKALEALEVFHQMERGEVPPDESLDFVKERMSA